MNSSAVKLRFLPISARAMIIGRYHSSTTHGGQPSSSLDFSGHTSTTDSARRPTLLVSASRAGMRKLGVFSLLSSLSTSVFLLSNSTSTTLKTATLGMKCKPACSSSSSLCCSCSIVSQRESSFSSGFGLAFFVPSCAIRTYLPPHYTL